MTVEWVDRAKNLLALIWVTATPAERDVLERAYHEINDRLSRGPQFLGESRREGERVWFYPPLAVRFQMIPHGPVKVTHVARVRATTTEDDDPPA
jgi:hypothetical protein